MGVHRHGRARRPLASPYVVRGRVPMDRSKSVRMSSSVGTSHAYVLGIDGRGMPGLAQSLVQMGMAVTGSESIPGGDRAGLRGVGVRVESEPVVRAFTARTRLLVHSPEVSREHPLRLGALRRGVRQATPAGWLGGQMQGRIGVAVAGGRVGSLAAAMTGFVLSRAGLDPTVLLGTAAPQLGGWARQGAGPHVVAEWGGDPEGYSTFRPPIALLMNVGSDPRVDLDGWVGALHSSLRALPDDCDVLALGHPSLIDLVPGSGGIPERLQWISLQRGGAWWGTDLREDSGRFRFRAFHKGRYVIEVRLRVLGLRGVIAALAAVAVCERLGVSAAAVRQGLEEFSGLARDFETRGNFRGVTLIDDEGEEPSDVRETLTQARRTFGGRRLWAVYAAPGSGEPRRYVSAFSSADMVLITDRASGGNGPSAAGSPSRVWTQCLTEAGVKARRAESLVEAISDLDRHLEPGDVLLTLGAGDVGTIADAFIRRLPRDRQGG